MRTGIDRLVLGHLAVVLGGLTHQNHQEPRPHDRSVETFPLRDKWSKGPEHKARKRHPKQRLADPVLVWAQLLNDDGQRVNGTSSGMRNLNKSPALSYRRQIETHVMKRHLLRLMHAVRELSEDAMHVLHNETE